MPTSRLNVDLLGNSMPEWVLAKVKGTNLRKRGKRRPLRKQ